MSLDFFMLTPGHADGTPMPAGLTVTTHSNFARIVVKVAESGVLATGETMRGYVNIVKGGAMCYGTEFRSTFGTDNYYASCFNLAEGTAYSLLVVTEIFNASGVKVREYRKPVSATTRATPTFGVRTSVYVDPVNGDDANDGSSVAEAVKTAGEVSTLGGAGVDIYLVGEDGESGGYVDFGDPTDVNNYRFNNIAGTSGNWCRILNYQNSVVTGARALDGPWTDEGDDIYSMTVTEPIGRVRDLSTGEILPFCRALEAADESGIVIALKRSTTFPGWYYKASTDTLYVRLVTPADPGTGRLRGAYKRPLAFNNCDFVYADLNIEDAGATDEVDLPVGESASINYAARMDNCDNFFLCGSVTGGYILVGSTCNNVTIEADGDNTGPWRQFMATDATALGGNDPYVQEESWSLWSHNPVMDIPLVANNGTGTVIRNLTSVGGGVLVAGGSGGSYMDVYDCTMSEAMDDLIEFEGNPGVASAIWNNRFSKGATMLSASSLDTGPVWWFGNTCSEWLHTALKIGGGDADEGHGRIIMANNAYEGTRDSADAGEGTQDFNGSHSGVESYNDVFVVRPAGATKWVFHADGSGYSIDKINHWENGYFYLALAGTASVMWSNTNYATFALAAAGEGAGEVEFVNMVIGTLTLGSVSPYPSGIDAGLNASLTTKSVRVRGITDEADVALASLSLGPFDLA